MKLVLVTGMSGAGKSVALKALEDCGFEAIDNIPMNFLPAVADANMRHLVVGIDIRSRDFSVEHLRESVGLLRSNPSIDFRLLFLDSDDEVLRRRFTETRRRHPLALDRTVMDGIHQERALIEGVREQADLVIDTSDYQASQLREVITANFAPEGRQLSLAVTSFSFKRGVPREADMVFDVRFLKNPHYDPQLRLLTGLDAPVGQMIESDDDFSAFFERLTGLVVPLLPRYLKEGKHYLTIAIGCTGGRHRSVYCAQKLGAFLDRGGYKVTVRHRDLDINQQGKEL